jgi:hypothetical protein
MLVYVKVTIHVLNCGFYILSSLSLIFFLYIVDSFFINLYTTLKIEIEKIKENNIHTKNGNYYNLIF